MTLSSCAERGAATSAVSLMRSCSLEHAARSASDATIWRVAEWALACTRAQGEDAGADPSPSWNLRTGVRTAQTGDGPGRLARSADAQNADPCPICTSDRSILEIFRPLPLN